MARHTSLYQSPRSPLIQGRTRWERPLWQAWLGGAALSALLLVVAVFVRGISTGQPFVLDRPVWWLLAGAVGGAGVGALLGRLWAWRQRWVTAALAGLLLGAGLYAITLFAGG